MPTATIYSYVATLLDDPAAAEDVTAPERRLAEARALRRSVLKQLAAATTSEQVASLKLRLRDANASIDSALSTLEGLRRQVDDSKISLTIQTAPAPVSSNASKGPFTLRRAAHDAGRVLVITAGVALIACAVLVPIGLAAALVAWVLSTIRRRRREQTLDLL